MQAMKFCIDTHDRDNKTFPAGRLRVYTLTPRGTEAMLYFIEPGET